MPITLYSGPLSQVDEHFVAKAGLFADEHLKHSAEHWEQTRQQPEKILRLAISQFAGIRIPKELGGHGGSAVTIARVYEELATEKNDTYVINGSKAWVTNGVNTDLLFVFTQTDPKLSAKGIAGFVIKPDMPGVSAKPAYNMLGNLPYGRNDRDSKHGYWPFIRIV